jgi:hypothetical protein
MRYRTSNKDTQVRGWLKRLFYSEELHRQTYRAWRDYPLAVINTASVFFSFGFALAMLLSVVFIPRS